MESSLMSQHNDDLANKPTKDESISNLPVKEVYGQLISILSNRRRDNNGKLIIGLRETELQHIFNHQTVEDTQELMKEFGEFLLSLGLTLVEFAYAGQTWYAIRSLYAAPIELKEEELAILGTFIMLTENKKDNKIDMTAIVEYLSVRDYFNEYKIKRIVKYLIDNGYIAKGKLGNLGYGPKLLIEINDEARTVIAEQASELLF